MKSLVFLFLFVGMIFIAIGYIKSNQECPPPIVEFRYLPQTFQESQEAPTPLLSIFGKMFREPDAWQTAVGYADATPVKGHNRFGLIDKTESTT